MCAAREIFDYAAHITLVIHDNGYQVSCPSEVMLPLLQCMKDCQQFPIVDVIISFNHAEGLGVISTGVEISIGVHPHKDSSSGSKGGVGHDMEWLQDIRHVQDRGRYKDFLELDKGFILSQSPSEGNPFLSEIMEGSSED